MSPKTAWNHENVAHAWKICSEIPLDELINVVYFFVLFRSTFVFQKSGKIVHDANCYKMVDIIEQGRVVRKAVNVYPGLNVNWSIKFSYLQMFFASNVSCSLRLLQLKTEGQAV